MDAQQARNIARAVQTAIQPEDKFSDVGKKIESALHERGGVNPTDPTAHRAVRFQLAYLNGVWPTSPEDINLGE